jgi:hypothetical protein
VGVEIAFEGFASRETTMPPYNTGPDNKVHKVMKTTQRNSIALSPMITAYNARFRRIEIASVMPN